MAKLVSFLVSDDSSFITGQTVSISNRLLGCTSQVRDLILTQVTVDGGKYFD